MLVTVAERTGELEADALGEPGPVELLVHAARVSEAANMAVHTIARDMMAPPGEGS